MKHYVLIFRPTRTLAPEEQKRRAGEIAAYVKHITEAGIELDPRAMGESIAILSQEGEGGQIISREHPRDPTFSNLLFFDCSSREQALEIAQTHPGLHFGTSIELREWTSPRQLTPVPQ